MLRQAIGQLSVRTDGRGFTDITSRVQQQVAQAGIGTGLCTLHLQHTSASLVIQENADPDVRRDFERFFARLVPDGDPLFVHHTSASLILCENADPTVRADLERFAARWAPDGDPIYRHVDEGPDDMPAHVRSVFAGASLVVPIADGRLDLGTWQGIYLWEHRTEPHRRRVSVTIVR